MTGKNQQIFCIVWEKAIEWLAQLNWQYKCWILLYMSETALCIL